MHYFIICMHEHDNTYCIGIAVAHIAQIHRTRSKASLGECQPYAHFSLCECQPSPPPTPPTLPARGRQWLGLLGADWELTLRGVEPSPPPTPPALRRGEAEHFNPSHPLESVARGAPTVRTRCYGYSDGYGTRRINQAPTMRRSDAKGKRE